GDDLPADRQAEAGAAVATGGRGVQLDETAEQLRLSFGRNADAGVRNRNRKTLVDEVEPDLHPALFSEFQSVRNQVSGHLTEPDLIADKPAAHAVAGLSPEFESLLGRQGGEHRLQARNESGGVDRRRENLELTRLGLRNL